MSKDEYNKFRSQFYNYGKGLHTKSLQSLIEILEAYQRHEYGACFLADAQIASYKRVIAERNVDLFKESVRSGGEWI